MSGDRYSYGATKRRFAQVYPTRPEGYDNYARPTGRSRGTSPVGRGTQKNRKLRGRSHLGQCSEVYTTTTSGKLSKALAGLNYRTATDRRRR
jgi:hypothetical protein